MEPTRWGHPDGKNHVVAQGYLFGFLDGHDRENKMGFIERVHCELSSAFSDRVQGTCDPRPDPRLYGRFGVGHSIIYLKK